jgi:hypothetical protein
MSNTSQTLDKIVQMSKQLPKSDRLRLISLLSEDIRIELDREIEPIDILTTAGLGAEVWRNVDVNAYLAQERSDWES